MEEHMTTSATFAGLNRSGNQRRPGDKIRYGWKSELKAILEMHNKESSDGRKTVSILTRRQREAVLYQGFYDLRGMGHKIENVRNFKLKHFKLLLASWEEQGLSPATIQNRISIFRIYADWIGKGNMIGPSVTHASKPENVTRSNIAEVDKSWSTNGIDFDEVLARIDSYDPYTGAQIRMIKAFGLRRLEAICFKPNRHWERHDGSEYGIIRVRDGTKGGRERVLMVETEEQYKALQHAKSIAGDQMNRSIGYPRLSLEQAVNRYIYVMSKFGLTKKESGVTGHGLRHQFANEEYEKLTGKLSPVRGGKKGDVDKLADKEARLAVTEKLGHSRLSVTASYYGSNRARSKPKASKPDIMD